MNESSERFFPRENPLAAYKGEWLANQYVNTVVKQSRLANSEEIVKNLNRRVLAPLLNPEVRDRIAGEYRIRDIMGVVGAGLSIPEGYQVPRLMRQYGEAMDIKLERIKCDNDMEVSDFIKDMGFAHYELVKIHPFEDGNGRVARHMMTLMCKLGGYRPLIIAPKHRKDYLDSLEMVNITKDQDYLNKFLAERFLQSYTGLKSRDNKQILHATKQASEISSFINSLNLKTSV